MVGCWNVNCGKMVILKIWIISKKIVSILVGKIFNDYAMNVLWSQDLLIRGCWCCLEVA